MSPFTAQTPATQTPTTLTIDGDAVTAEKTFDVINPATGETFATAPETTVEHVDAAFDAAARAFPDWRADEDARRATLRAMADAVDAAAGAVAPVLTAEQGKPLSESQRELRTAALWLRYYADLEREREVIRDDRDALVEVVRRPLGPVAAIAPWNFPITIGVAKVAPALRAGNTVVWKPSPFTPLSTLMLGEALRAVAPAGVLNVITGGGEIGAAMTAHPLTRKISFTGSTATGKKIAAAASADLKRLTLELGGNDAAIVLDDADPGRVAERLFATAFSNSGQVCVAPKRVYAARSVLPALVDALAERARAAKVGDGADPATELGPINNAPQRDRVAELVADALARGAVAAAGGKAIEGPGYFFEPTILTGVGDGVRIVDEEQFGPALPVIAFDDVEDALARANASTFGLGGSVWSGDADRATAVAARLESGMSWVNTHTALSAGQPFAGVKWSGLGVEGGLWGLDGFTDIKLIHRAR
ncbi:aldehyde dehydrogenase [Planotetraspora thailandica]|uniref:Aldehyde dehydrogenase n=2 Tax=Planotetraspora thailandica TaxID=487172 RepID=A0A8J3V322_9ACTN|nr:aldehyde dehydrogenase [Planotetraspora thailandica]